MPRVILRMDCLVAQPNGVVNPTTCEPLQCNCQGSKSATRFNSQPLYSIRPKQLGRSQSRTPNEKNKEFQVHDTAEQTSHKGITSKQDSSHRSGYRYLAQNLGVLTISNFATKILSFFLVPLYTSVLTTGEYGTFDLMNTTVSLLIPILTLNIAEGVLRFSLDRDADQSSIFTIGLRYTVGSILLVACALIFNVLVGISPEITQWWPMFLAIYVANSLQQIVSYQVRGLDRMNDVAVAGVISSVVTISLNIILLLPLHMGLTGYFYATVGGSLSQVIYLVPKASLWRYVKKDVDKSLDESMRKYSIPMMANAIAWWVNSVSDRYVVTFFCGITENGIYAVGSKIPQILNVLQTIFNQAWVLSAVHEFDPEDKDGFYLKTYNAYGFLMVAACSALIVLNRPLAHFLYASDFYVAWKYVPFLMMSMVWGALSGHIGGVFAAVKNSALYATTTTIGAISNLIINLLFVPIFGAQGAAVSTTISYWLVWVLRRRKMVQYIHIRLNLIRDYISYGVLLAQATLLLLMPEDTVLIYALESALFVVTLLLYRKEIGMWLHVAQEGAKAIRAKEH